MKEARLFDPSLTHHWTFTDNMSVVDNPRVKSTVFGNPTYNNGVATFNGSTDYYKLKTLINLGTKYSIEVKIKASFTANGSYFLSGYTINNALFQVYKNSNDIYHIASGTSVFWRNYNTDLLWHTYTFVRNGTSISLYIDGVFISTKTLPSNTNLYIQSIGALENGTYKWNGSIEYIKIWNRQLSASEVKNNVAGKTYKSLPYKATTLFHINSDNGVIRDLTGKTNPVPTNVQLPKIGSNKAVMKFDGLSGNINLGSQALVGDITFMGWSESINRGEGDNSIILTNGQVIIRLSGSANKVFVFSRNNGTTTINSLLLSWKESLNIFICVTSTSTGITNFYIGDKNNPPVLSGTANQNAGTPVAGTTCYLGNRAGDDRTLNGWENDVRCEQSILTIEEITQQWSNTKYKY
jgi:hypothetical protein